MLGNKTGLSIEKLFESPFAGKHPELINKGAEAAAAEAAVTAAEAIAVADLEETKRLAVEFEAMGGGALTMAFAQKPNPGTTCASAGSHTSGSACRRPARINRAEILTARTDTAAEVAEVAAAEAAAAVEAVAVPIYMAK